MSPLLAALVAGTGVGAACGASGLLVVLRRQVLAGDALGHVAFTGAVGALALGIDPRIGLVVLTVAVAGALGLLGRRGRPDDVLVGGSLAWVLGVGVLALSAFARHRSGGSAGAGAASALFGSLLSLTGAHAAQTLAVCAAVVAGLIALGRPLLFASLDEDGAVAAGLPVRLLGVAVLVLLGLTTAAAAPAVGALLVLGLLTAPAGVALALCTRPQHLVAVATGTGVVVTWLGLAVCWAVPQVPPSTGVIAVATAALLSARLAVRRSG